MSWSAALLLGSGEVAERLPEVFGQLPEMPDEAVKAEQALLDRVAEQLAGVLRLLRQADPLR